jgi:predicted TIM-barrel fold metal-dependent hydrolase
VISPSDTTAASPLAGRWSGPVVDADVHISPPSVDALFPYLDEVWREFAMERGFGEGTWNATSVTTSFPPNAPITAREDWRPADGSPPGSDLSLLREHVLDRHGVELAVVSCYFGIDALRHPDYSAAMAAAVNDWMIAEWLEVDDRLRGSLVLPAHDPAAMAAEIERVGGHPRVRQVFLPIRSEHLYGRRMYLPVFEAAVKHDLVVGLHFGGSSDGPPTPVGFPSWYAEEYGGATQLFFSQIMSIVAEGLLQRFPSLKIAVLEGGFLWLPGIMWRLDKEWKGLRRDIPWVGRPPSSLVRERFRFSVAPVDAGPPEHMAILIDHLEAPDLLMFATDYPHDHQRGLEELLDVLSEEMTENLMHRTARELYGD